MPALFTRRRRDASRDTHTHSQNIYFAQIEFGRKGRRRNTLVDGANGSAARRILGNPDDSSGIPAGVLTRKFFFCLLSFFSPTLFDCVGGAGENWCPFLKGSSAREMDAAREAERAIRMLSRRDFG